MGNKTKRDTIRAALVKQTAEITGVSVRSVERVLAAQQENEKVLQVYLEMQQGNTALVDAVKELVPFL
jgi:hypothetical protein